MFGRFELVLYDKLIQKFGLVEIHVNFLKDSKIVEFILSEKYIFERRLLQREHTQ
jgi:hypothetical protein